MGEAVATPRRAAARKDFMVTRLLVRKQEQDLKLRMRRNFEIRR
jgi:hypothetical protein